MKCCKVQGVNKLSLEWVFENDYKVKISQSEISFPHSPMPCHKIGRVQIKRMWFVWVSVCQSQIKWFYNKTKDWTTRTEATHVWMRLYENLIGAFFDIGLSRRLICIELCHGMISLVFIELKVDDRKTSVFRHSIENPRWNPIFVLDGSLLWNFTLFCLNCRDKGFYVCQRKTSFFYIALLSHHWLFDRDNANYEDDDSFAIRWKI